MIFMDTSVWLRVLLKQPGMWSGWRQVKDGFMSELVSIETLRTLDRLRITGQLTAEAVVAAHGKLRELEARFQRVNLSRNIIRRAAAPMPSVLGTLDAFHLASALVVQEKLGTTLTFVTHDAQLGAAARLLNFVVDGVGS